MERCEADSFLWLRALESLTIRRTTATTEGKATDVLPLMQTTGAAMQAVIEEKMRLFRP